MPVKLNFTVKALEALPVPASGRTVYYDERTRGLLFKIEPSGAQTFAWYRKIRKWPTWKNLGAYPDLPIETARQRADELNAAAAKWKSGNYDGPSPFERPAVLTLDSLVDEYVEKYVKHNAKRPAKAEAHLRWFVKRYMPALRERTVGSISKHEIRTLHRKAGEKHGHSTANHCVKTLRALYNFAKKEDLWAGISPAEGHTLFKENQRARFLQPDELPKLWKALSVAPNPDLRDFVNLSLWCGARKSDTMAMRWQDVKLDENKWDIPDPKAEPYAVPLTPEAVAILKARRARADAFAAKTGIAASPFVFPSHGATGHVVDLKGAWKQLLKDAGLDYPDAPELRLRQHDLRRSFGSYMAAGGASLLMIGKALGHSDPSATKVYARLDLAPVRQEMEKAQLVMRALMRKKPAQLPAGPKQKAARRG